MKKKGNAKHRISDKAARNSATPFWFREAVFYELHVRSFMDSNGDGLGDFIGLTSKLDYLKDLGINVIWLLPFYPSPLRDDGYDIADYRRVNPSYGTLEDFKEMVCEAHSRGIRIITELVMNHTSDQHPWFQRARKAPKGSPERDFYVWSDDPHRYPEARIIFSDFESSNWTWDPVAGQYFWHRFYSHQPDLNFENPIVHDEMLAVCDFWFEMGIDGIRLDAVPYLYEEEGTTCENLPRTHDFLKKLRSHIDSRFPGSVLLAEANQWPEDAIAYFGQGDECNMAFHFPLMPRLYMSLEREDRFPIIDILRQTPAIPEACQWALFLRNHDELTLEMVTDEERDYMYRVYANDPAARINMGIRRRLTPLVKGNRRKIELLHGLLFSLPGTPILYYGDEIGMGDNVYLGDRNGVRTPMQWSADRNAGFSRANPQKLFLPVIIDPEYHFEMVNVELQLSNPTSFLWWVRRLIALRKRHSVFGSGSMLMLSVPNRKVLAFVRQHENETILIVANLSRFSQPAELDLSAFAGHTPVELFGSVHFPPIEESRYLLTLGPHSFYWLELRAPEWNETVNRSGQLPQLAGSGGFRSWFEDEPFVAAFKVALARASCTRSWFLTRIGELKEIEILDWIILPTESPDKNDGAMLLIARAVFYDGEPVTYAFPLSFIRQSVFESRSELSKDDAVAIVTGDQPSEQWVISFCWSDPLLREAIMGMLKKRKSLKGRAGSLELNTEEKLSVDLISGEKIHRLISKDGGNVTYAVGDQLAIKVYRALAEGENPDVEMSRFLTTQAGLESIPRFVGSIDYQGPAGEISTVAKIEAYVPNQGNLWLVASDQIARYLEHFYTMSPEHLEQLKPLPEDYPLGLSTFEGADAWLDLMEEMPHIAVALGRATASMHRASAEAGGASKTTAPEPPTPHWQYALFQTVRSEHARVCQLLSSSLNIISEDYRDTARNWLSAGDRIETWLKEITKIEIDSLRIRIHGDFTLSEVLKRENDCSIIDFEGDPLASLTQRRIKRMALRDIASMLRSVSNAANLVAKNYAGLEDYKKTRLAVQSWIFCVSSQFLQTYISEVHKGSLRLVPSDAATLKALLKFLLFERTLGELSDALKESADNADIPLRALSELSGF